MTPEREDLAPHELASQAADAAVDEERERDVTSDAAAAEWNAGYDAFQAGRPIHDEPNDVTEDMWRAGYIYAAFSAATPEVDALLSTLAITRYRLRHE